MTIRTVVLFVCAGLVGCADKLTGPQAQSAAVAYQDDARVNRSRILVDGVERDSVFLRRLDKSLVDSILIDELQTLIADGVNPPPIVTVRIYTHPAARADSIRKAKRGSPP